MSSSFTSLNLFVCRVVKPHYLMRYSYLGLSVADCVRKELSAGEGSETEIMQIRNTDTKTSIHRAGE